MKPHKIEPAAKTYFYRLPNGKVDAMQAKEAWTAHQRGWKLEGVSDGKTYQQAVIEAQQLFAEQGQEAAQERLRRGKIEEYKKAKGNLETPPNSDVHGEPRAVEVFRNSRGL